MLAPDTTAVPDSTAARAPASGPRAPADSGLTRRVRIATGLRCNLDCKFCYYNEELNTQSYSTAQIREMLDLARGYGIEDIDFSGGEPTLRADLPELIAYAQSLGFRRICMITNGLKTARRAYLAALQEAGLNELLVSVHGHAPETHDPAVGAPGAHRKVMRTLTNAAALALRTRTNTVVNRHNAATLPAIAELLAEVRPVAANFICFNDWVNASPMTREIAVRYSEVAPGLRAAVTRLAPTVSKVTVRYIPFCFMEGLEAHVCGLLQNDSDGDEWNDAVKRVVTDRDPAKLARYVAFLGDVHAREKEHLHLAVLPPADRAALDERGTENPFAPLSPAIAAAAHRVENYAKRSQYVKTAGCATCSRRAICDGLERAYADWVGTAELTPIPGEVIRDPLHFRRDYARHWE